jgi:hypothetical protein
MDNSRVGSLDRQTHLCHLEAFFKALAANGLAINLEKCVFGTPSLEILGHRISATGATSTADHAAYIKNCPSQDIKQLQCFLDMVNFYCCFLPNCAQVLKPLTDLWKWGSKMLEWTVSAQGAFQDAKRLLAAAVPLQHPAPNAELSLATDASDTHNRGVMQQKSGDHWWALGFFSRKLTDTESSYSTFDRKLFAAHAAIKHFRHFCEGRAFQLRTDHKPLVTAISRVSALISPRQQRHLAFISEFNVQLLYLPGLKNVAADFLSHPNQTTAGSVPATTAADPVDFEEMAAEQNRCPETQHLLGGTSLKLPFRQTGAHHLAGDISTGNFQLCFKTPKIQNVKLQNAELQNVELQNNESYRTPNLTEHRILQNFKLQNLKSYRMSKYKISKIQNVENNRLGWFIYGNNLFLSTLQLTT